MMGCIYFPDTKTVPVYIDTLVKTSGQVGTLIGQLLFGYLGYLKYIFNLDQKVDQYKINYFLADKYGRKKMYGIELFIILIGTVGSALSADLKTGFSVFAVLGMW